jgi:hypothetical protein
MMARVMHRIAGHRLPIAVETVGMESRWPDGSKTQRLRMAFLAPKLYRSGP